MRAAKIIVVLAASRVGATLTAKSLRGRRALLSRMSTTVENQAKTTGEI